MQSNSATTDPWLDTIQRITNALNHEKVNDKDKIRINVSNSTDTQTILDFPDRALAMQFMILFVCNVPGHGYITEDKIVLSREKTDVQMIDGQLVWKSHQVNRKISPRCDMETKGQSANHNAPTASARPQHKIQRVV